MRTHHTSTPNPSAGIRKPLTRLALVGTGLLFAGTTLASAAHAAPSPAEAVGPGVTLQTLPPITVRPTTTTTRRPLDVCRIVPERCHPPVDPCTGKPRPQPELREQDLTIRTIPPRPTTTRPCPTTTTRPEHKRPPVIVDPPIRVTPTFTG